MRTITLEEHFVSPGFLNGPGRGLKEQAKNPEDLMARVLGQLSDLDDGRVRSMDDAGIDMQVLSLNSPGVEQLGPDEAAALASESNDYLAEAIKKFPKRFAGFAAIPTAAPEKAATELERMVREHGFRGAIINGHGRGRYLDDKFFSPFLERAAELDVPIYLHPTRPPQQVIDAWFGGFAPQVSFMLAGAGWGWHIETAIHVIRLILGGTFDRYPKLQIVIGHLGETLPFMIQRLDIMSGAITKLERPISSYLRENLHYTFSGFNFTPTFIDLFLQVGVDRIMFSADYPYGSMVLARAFLDQLPVSTSDREKIAHGNAERLLHL